MASLRRVLRTAREINRELREAAGISIRGPRGGAGGSTRDLVAVRSSLKRVEKALKPDPVAERRLL